VGAVFGVSSMGMACLAFPILILMWVLYCISKGLEAQRVEKIEEKNGESEPEAKQSPMYAALNNKDAESGKLSERSGTDHRGDVARAGRRGL
jgi:amino acid permease